MAKTFNHKPEKKHEYNIKENGKNDTGAPELYTNEYLSRLAKEFLDWSLIEDNFWFKDFCLDKSIPPQNISEFANKSKEFREAYIIVKERCESKLVKKALARKHDGYFSFQVLKQMHEWKDKTETDVNLKTFEHYQSQIKDYKKNG